MPAFVRSLPLLILLAGCTATGIRPDAKPTLQGAGAVVGPVWQVETVRLEGEGAQERLGIALAPDLIVTSLDVASFPERLTGFFLIEEGARTASLEQGISGSPTDLDVALMRVVDLATYARLEREVPPVVLCAEQAPEGSALAALGRGADRYPLTVGPALAPGYHTREITFTDGQAPSGAPVIAADCLAGIHSAGRLIQASGLQYLLKLIQP